MKFYKVMGISTLRINLPLFSTVVPSNICMFLFCRPFVVITTLSTGLVGVEVLNWDVKLRRWWYKYWIWPSAYCTKLKMKPSSGHKSCVGSLPPLSPMWPSICHRHDSPLSYVLCYDPYRPVMRSSCLRGQFPCAGTLVLTQISPNYVPSFTTSTISLHR